MNFRIVIFAAFTAGIAANPANAEIRQFKDWLAVCDNLRNCTAYGFDTEIGAGMFLKIERGGAPTATPKITIAVDVPDKTTRFSLAFDDATLPGLPKDTQRGVRHEDDTYARALIGEPSAAEAFLSSIRRAQKIVAKRTDEPGTKNKSDTETSAVSLSGAAAALLWIDEQQKRLDTVTAIVRRGDKPASSVPPQPAMPVVVAAKPIAMPAPKIVPKAVLREAKAQCEDDDGERKTEDIYRLTDKVVLFMFHCESNSGAYNQSYNLLVAPTDKPSEVKALDLPLPPAIDKRRDIPAQDMTNPAFEPKTMTLSTFSKGRGIGDCGSESIWVFDGKVFRLTSFKMMPDCKGVPLWEWAPLYTATVK